MNDSDILNEHACTQGEHRPDSSERLIQNALAEVERARRRIERFTDGRGVRYIVLDLGPLMATWSSHSVWGWGFSFCGRTMWRRGWPRNYQRRSAALRLGHLYITVLYGKPLISDVYS